MKKEIIQSIARTALLMGLMSGAGCEYYTEAPVSTEELEKNLDLLGDQIAGIPTPLPATTEGPKSSVDEGLVADLQQKLSALEEQVAATSGADEALIAGFQEKIKALEEQIAALTTKDPGSTETEPADTTGPEGIKPWDFQSKAGPWVWTTPGAMAGVKKSIPNPGTEDPETSKEGEPAQPGPEDNLPENNLKDDSGAQVDGADVQPGGETKKESTQSFIKEGNKAISGWLAGGAGKSSDDQASGSDCKKEDAVQSEYDPDALTVPLVVKMCAHPDFKGGCAFAASDLVAGKDQVAVLPTGVDQKVSSISVSLGPNHLPGGNFCVAYFYDNVHGEGEPIAQLIPGDYPNLDGAQTKGGINDKIRSVRFLNWLGEPCSTVSTKNAFESNQQKFAWPHAIKLVVALHTHPDPDDKNNRTTHVLSSVPDLSDVKMHDDVDSVTVWKGPHFKNELKFQCQATLFKDKNFGGNPLITFEVDHMANPFGFWEIGSQYYNKADSLKISCSDDDDSQFETTTPLEEECLSQ